MSNQMSRKSLWMALLVVVMVLAMVVCFAGCNNEQAETQTTAPATTVGADEAERVDLYWNLDRAMYDGKSEAGMSSREPGEDGYFHVRFFKDGEIVELRVADRKTINAMEVQDLMGLEFDEDGLVVGVIPVDDMPIEKLAWQFYVQSVGGKLIKTNSSASLNGMEILLETNESTGVWDMTGLSGDIGCAADAMQLDRIMALGDADGNVTHVFIYERPNYMKTHEGECEHCEKTVTWYEWTKTDSLPINGGHYQLMNDLSGVRQCSMVEDAKICLDLNGKRVDGNSGSRIYSLHNAGTELAIMDTSEAKTGTIAAHGQGDQGMVVWVRYGVFYLYDGILDGSDARTYLNGPTVNMGSNTYFYMYGGELIGGVADTKSNGKGGWTGGVAGTLFIGANSKFVMNDGMIRDGYAKGKITKYDANGKPTSVSCGGGGNIYANTGAVIEMNGGTIRDGYAAYYGNICLGGKVEMTMNAGLIAGGNLYMPNQNGGNIGVGSTAKFIMNGGTIRNGRAYNCAGNVYLNGTFQMNDGMITDGKILSWGTNVVNESAQSRNVFNVNGDFYMYGGRIAGGFQSIDTDAKSNPTILLVSARSVIFDEDGTGPHMTLSNTAGGGICDVYVGQLHDEAKIGVSAVQNALFTHPTDEKNADNFVSEVADADIIWTEDGIAIGRGGCVCGGKAVGMENHTCKDVLWAPWTSTSSLPTTTGNFYLVNDVVRTEQTVVYAQDVAIDLRGHNITFKVPTRTDGYRFLRVQRNVDENNVAYGPGANVSFTDSTANPGTVKVVMPDYSGASDAVKTAMKNGNQGMLFWLWDQSSVTVYDGIFDGTQIAAAKKDGATVDVGGGSTFNMYGGTIKPGTIGWSSNIRVNGTMNMYGGTITGGSANYGGNIGVYGTLNMKGGTVSGGTASDNGGNIRVNENATFNMSGGTVSGGSAIWGGNIDVNKSTLNMTGGTITGGNAIATSAWYAIGGNLYITGAKANVTITGEDTVISNGKLTPSTEKTWSPGGNIYANSGATVTIDGGATVTGGNAGTAGPNGHNIYITTNSTKLNLGDCTIHNTGTKSASVYVEAGTVTMTGATLTNAGNFSTNITSNNTADCVANFIINEGTTITGGTNANIILYQDDVCTMNGGTVADGSSTYGGNIYMAKNAVFNLKGGTITGGVATATNNPGANLALDGSSVFNMTGGTITRGTAAAWGANVAVWPSATFNMSAGTVSYGTAPVGANIYATGTVNITGGTVEYGTATNGEGGNIYVESGAKVTITGGATIARGSATGHGHNIYMLGNSTTMYLGNCTVHNTSASRSSIMAEGGTLTMEGATISNTGSNMSNIRTSNTSGCVANVIINAGTTITGGTNANICVFQDDVCTMNGGTITNGSATYGGNVYLEKNAIFNLKAGNITNGVATTTTGAANVAMAGNSVFNMTGGTITKGVGAGNGGNVSIWPSSTFNMSAGTISYGKAQWGGNIYTEGTLNITGGTIEEGTTTKGAGGANIYIYGGNVNLSAGTVRWGKYDNGSGANYAETSCNFRVEKGNLNMTGGHVYGRMIAGGSGVINISGSSKIYYVKGNGEECFYDNNLTMGGTINIGQLSSNAVIGVMSTDASYAANTDDNLTKAFANIVDGATINPGQFYGKTVLYVDESWVSNNNYKIVASGGKLYLVPVTTTP